jgi:prevent-host-death family protein
MSAHPPILQRVALSDVPADLSSLVGRINRHEARVVVEQNGHPVAAIVSTEDLQRLTEMDRQRAERFKVVEDLRGAFANSTEEELEREAARAIREVREERYPAGNEQNV